MKKMLQLIKILSVLIIGVIGVSADSLWHKDQGTLYATQRISKVGDIITVYISNQSSAVQEAGTDTSTQSGIGIDFYDMWDKYSLNSEDSESLRKLQNYDLGGRGGYSGLGKTSRTSKVKAIVSVIVTKVLPNGNLIIAGEHQVNVNEENETIRISGVVRAQDIRSDNSIYSHQIAQVQVSVKGEGVVGAKQSPGVLTKMFGWIL